MILEVSSIYNEQNVHKILRKVYFKCCLHSIEIKKHTTVVQFSQALKSILQIEKILPDGFGIYMSMFLFKTLGKMKLTLQITTVAYTQYISHVTISKPR